MDPRDFANTSTGFLVKTEEVVRTTIGGRLQEEQVEAWAFVPHSLPPELPDSTLAALIMPLVEAERAQAGLEAQILQLPNPNMLLKPMQRREVKFSSQIEDTIASIEEAAIASLNNHVVSEDTRDVERNRLALERGSESPLPMSLRLLREMHDVLMRGGRGDRQRPGEFREVMVRIGGDTLSNARFVPPPPGEHLNACLADYEKFLNPQSYPRRRYPFLLELAMSHYQFESIHPFRDGNGRLGRLIISLSGQKDGTMQVPLPYVSGYFEAHRQEYYDCLLSVSQKGDWVRWFKFFCHAVKEECTRDRDRASRLLELRGVARDFSIRNSRSTNLLQLVDLLFASPAVDVAAARRWLDVTQPTAQRYISLLEQNGFLTEVTGFVYGRYWVARPIIKILDE